MFNHHMLSIIDVLGALIIPTYAAQMLNLGTMQNADFSMLLSMCIKMLAAALISGAAMIAASYFCSDLTSKVAADMRNALYEKTMRLSGTDFRTFGTASVTTRTVSDITNIQFALGNCFQMLFPVPFIFIVSLVFAFRIDGLLGLILLAVLIIISTYNHEAESIETVANAVDGLRLSTRRADFLQNCVNPLIRLLSRVSQAVIMLVSCSWMLQGKMTIGIVQAFFQYINIAAESLTETSYMINSLQSALASAERTFAFIDAEEEIPDTTSPAFLTAAKGEIAFHNISFGYTSDKILMKHIDFTAQPGQKIAVVGSTGAGKTTLINLLMRFYEINGGTITIDGIPTTDLTRKDLRSNFGMVLQDTWLFSGTVAENIAYGKPDATMDEIKAAAKAAHYHCPRIPLQSSGYYLG